MPSGVNIGGTEVAAGPSAGDGSVLLGVERAAPWAQGAQAVARFAAELARGTAARAAAEGLTIVGMGLAVGGQLDVRRQRVAGATDGNRPLRRRRPFRW